MVAVAIRLGLRVFSLRTMGRLVGRLPRGSARRGDPRSEDIERAVAGALSVVPSANCLVQALTVAALYRRRGEVASMRLGFARDAGGAIEGHAWVESGGRVVAGRPTRPFAPATELAQAPR